MEKRNKKKLFAIIGGSVLAFVLTIALSVSITLAYFGDTGNNTKTLNMAGGIYLSGNTAAEKVQIVGTFEDQYYPGQTAALTGKLGVYTNADATSSAYVVISADSVTTDFTDGLVTVTFATAEGSDTSKGTWVEATVGEDKYYVLCTGSTPYKVELSGETPVTVEFDATVDFSEDITNTHATKTVTINLQAVAIQTVVFADGVEVENPTAAQVATFAADFAA